MNELLVVSGMVQYADGLKDLADAIRIGSERFSKCTRSLFRIMDGALCCCVLGAALVGRFPQASEAQLMSMRGEYDEYTDILPEFGLPSKLMVIHPEKPDDGPYLLTTVMYELNDVYMWPRGDVAKWLEGLANGA